MRIPLTCMKCSEEQGKPDKRSYPAELQDNGLYVLKCAVGHQTVTCLQNQKYDVLFELAANAILDGYYREAVISFTSCLERFYQFYLQIMSIKHRVLKDNFTKAWKSVSDKSERQLGAYIIAFTMETGKPPVLLKPSMVSFRNDVIHKGKIPSKEEAIQYGQAVLDLVAPALAKLKEQYPEHVLEAIKRHVMETRNQIQGNPRVQFMGINTTISTSRVTGQTQRSLLDTLKRLRMMRMVGL